MSDIDSIDGEEDYIGFLDWEESLIRSTLETVAEKKRAALVATGIDAGTIEALMLDTAEIHADILAMVQERKLGRTEVYRYTMEWLGR